MRRQALDDPDLTLDQMFRRWPATAGVFLAHRTLCFGCPIAPFHSVLDTCAEYGLDEAGFRRELRQAIGADPDRAAIPPRR